MSAQVDGRVLYLGMVGGGTAVVDTTVVFGAPVAWCFTNGCGCGRNVHGASS
jgi:hypothetical protein